jgi:hypothetical protein
MAALAGTLAARPGQRPRRRRGLIASVSAVILVALLAGGVYWAYAALLNPTTQLASARDLPADTFYFTSLDLVAQAASGHHINPNAPGQRNSSTDLLKQATGLDWQSDVVPWLGRLETFGAFPTPPGAGAAQGAQPGVGFVLLLDSHDDAAAQRALQKALAFQQQRNNPYSATTYDGDTLYVSQSNGPPSATVGAVAVVNGHVILAGTADAAHEVIDRLNGRGAVLADTPEFQQAMASLPSARFATVYVNLRALASLFGVQGGAQQMPILDTYPIAAGYAAWTQLGVRAQVTFKAAQAGLLQGTLSSDTTGLAALVPANASLYAGVANLGLLASNAANLAQPGGAPVQDPLLAALGIPASDPALTQPAAVVMLPPSAEQSAAGSTGAGAILIREPNAAAAHSALERLARHKRWTARHTLIAGVPATAFYGRLDSVSGWLPGGAPGAPYQPDPAATGLVAVTSLVNGTLVLAPARASLAAVIETAQGSQPNLAQTSSFRQIVSQAPVGAAASLYVNLPGLGQTMAPGTPGTGAAQSLGGVFLFTLVWNDSELQTTYDMAIGQ